MLTLIIIIITAVVSLATFSQHDLIMRYSLQPTRILQRNQWYRMVTSGFLHADWAHLFFNLFSLFFFGRQLEVFFQIFWGEAGLWYYLGLYLAGMIIANVPSLVRHRHDPHYSSLGASGAVSAIIFAAIVINPISDICLYGIICLPGFIMGLLYLLYTAWASRQQNDNINHDAHLYGALFGILFMAVAWPDSINGFIEQLSQWQFFR